MIGSTAIIRGKHTFILKQRSWKLVIKILILMALLTYFSY